MKTSKRFSAASLILIITMFFISGSLFAQQGERPGPSKIPSNSEIETMVNELSAELSLSKNQQIEILELYTTHFSEISASMETKGGERKSREEMETHRSDFEKDVKSLLNKEQKIKFEEFMKSQKKQSRPENSRR